MARTRLSPGPYRLSADVENPSPRPRLKKDWTKHAVWKAGTRFVVEPMHTGAKTVFLRPAGAGLAFTLEEKPDSVNAELNRTRRAQFDRIAAALVPIEDDVDTLFERLGVDAYDLTLFLKHLIATGVLTTRQFEQALARWNAAAG